MTLRELVRRVPHFAGLTHPDKIKLFAWWLHVHGKQERFDVEAIRRCYAALDLHPSANPAQDLARLESRRPRVLLRNSDGYRLEGQLREAFDIQYGQHETVIAVSQLLKNLLGKVSDSAERLFLSEALTCYQHQAFRAAIIMTWNVAYDHLLRWILATPERLSSFNTTILVRYGKDAKKAGLLIKHRIDFEALRESEVIEICGTASLFSGNLKRILVEKLGRRNAAAHPSLVEITRAQADDAITDLVNNVVLALT